MSNLFGQSTPLEAPLPLPAVSAKRTFFSLNLSRGLQLHRGLALGVALFITLGPVSSAQGPAKVDQAATRSIDHTSNLDKPRDSQGPAMLGEERERIQEELTADRTEQAALNKQMSAETASTASPYGYDFNIGRIRAELVKARADHDEAVTRLTSLDASSTPSSAALDAAVNEVIASDLGLWGMKTALSQRRTMVMWKVANFPPNYPSRKQDDAELAQLNGALDAMAKDLRAKAATRIQQRLRTDLERTAGLEAQLSSELGQMTAAMGNGTSKQLRANDLTTDIARLQTRYAAVDQQWHRLTPNDVASGSASQNSPAAATRRAASSNAVRNGILIGFAGFFLGMLATVAASKMNPKAAVAVESSYAADQTPQATAMTAQAQPKTPEPLAVPRRSSPAVPDRLAVQAELTLVPPSASTASRTETAIQQAPVPTPLEVVRPLTQPEFVPPSVVPVPQPVQTASASPSVEPAKPFIQSALAPPPVVPAPQLIQPAPQRPQADAPPAAKPWQPEPAQAVKAREPLPAASRPETREQTKTSQAVATQSLQRALSMGDSIKTASPNEEIRQPELEAAVSDSGSRVSGLRNLLFGRGAKNPHKTPDPNGESVDFLKQLDRALEQPIVAQPGKAATDMVHSTRHLASTVSGEWVTARPEFLPPRPMVETTDNERTGANSTTADRDRLDPNAEVEIGSSWRGQYQRKA